MVKHLCFGECFVKLVEIQIEEVPLGPIKIRVRRLIRNSKCASADDFVGFHISSVPSKWHQHSSWPHNGQNRRFHSLSISLRSSDGVLAKRSRTISRALICSMVYVAINKRVGQLHGLPRSGGRRLRIPVHAPQYQNAVCRADFDRGVARKLVRRSNWA